MSNAARALDQLSTSQTRFPVDLCGDGSQGRGEAPSLAFRCAYNAPYFTSKTQGGAWVLIQGNCHHWDCPRCGEIQARKAYGNIVVGARALASQGYGLHFVTLTSPGKECSLQDAEDNFLLWTNRLFTAWRTRVKRSGGAWEYAAVTERQKRGHPHLHVLTIATVGDEVLKDRYRYEWVDGRRRRKYYKTLRSDWLEKRIASAGLGREYDMQVVEDPEALSRYLAKYLFKDTSFTVWPDGWRRVRYSQGWPKMPAKEATGDWHPVVTADDWRALSVMSGGVVHLRGGDADIERARAMFAGVVLASGSGEVGL